MNYVTFLAVFRQNGLSTEHHARPRHVFAASCSYLQFLGKSYIELGNALATAAHMFDSSVRKLHIFPP